MCLFQVALQRSPASIIMPISLVISTAYLVVIGSWLFHERLPASPVLLAMRLGGGVAAVAVAGHPDRHQRTARQPADRPRGQPRGTPGVRAPMPRRRFL